MGRVRLQDVAEAAGVSIKTASNVVTGTGRVSPATRERVAAAMALLQYKPNPAARYLRRGTSGMVAVALPELTQPYFAELASELVRAAKAAGLTVLLAQTDGLAETERSIADGVDLPLMDGLIISPLRLTAQELSSRTEQGPLVVLGEHLGDDPPFPHVAIDNRLAAQVATEHLIALGRGRVGAVGAQDSGPRRTAVMRLEGYRRALDAAGRAYRPELVGHVTDFHRSDGARAMSALLDLPEPPDAVFCFNDALALGALRALRERGVRVPEDVAVIGIDDVEEGRYASPSLSTVAPDKAGLARAAIELLVEPDSPPRTVTAGFHLVVRESTGGAVGGVGRDGATGDVAAGVATDDAAAGVATDEAAAGDRTTSDRPVGDRTTSDRPVGDRTTNDRTTGDLTAQEAT